MSFITADELKSEIADELHLANVNLLPPTWDRPISRAVEQSYQDIRNGLVVRGYTPDQIDQWPGGHAFQLTLATYWALVFGHGLHGTDPTWVKMRDIRADLKTVGVELPGGGVTTQSPGVVKAGRLNTDDDRWSEDNFRF